MTLTVQFFLFLCFSIPLFLPVSMSISLTEPLQKQVTMPNTHTHTHLNTPCTLEVPAITPHWTLLGSKDAKLQYKIKCMNMELK